MNNTLLEQAEQLAQRRYTTLTSREELSDGSYVFVAYNPELPGCKSDGETPEEAKANLAHARIDYIYFLLEDGLSVPEPASQALDEEMAINIQTSTFSFAEGMISIEDKSSHSFLELLEDKATTIP